MGTKSSGKTTFLRSLESYEELKTSDNIDFVNKHFSDTFGEADIKFWNQALDTLLPTKIMKKALGFIILMDVTDPNGITEV